MKEPTAAPGGQCRGGVGDVGEEHIDRKQIGLAAAGDREGGVNRPVMYVARRCR